MQKWTHDEWMDILAEFESTPIPSSGDFAVLLNKLQALRDAKKIPQEPYDPSEFVPDLDQPQSVEQMAAEMRSWHKNTCNWFHWDEGSGSQWISRQSVAGVYLSERQKLSALYMQRPNIRPLLRGVTYDLTDQNRNDIILIISFTAKVESVVIDHPNDVKRFMDWIGIPLPSEGTK